MGLKRKAVKKEKECSCRIDDLKKDVEDLEALIKEKTEELTDARIKYFRAKFPLKEGLIYFYRDKEKSVKGQLFLERSDFSTNISHYYKLRLMKNDGSIGGQVRIVYDPSKLKLAEE